MVWEVLAAGFEPQSDTCACQECQNPESAVGPGAV